MEDFTNEPFEFDTELDDEFGSDFELVAEDFDKVTSFLEEMEGESLVDEEETPVEDFYPFSTDTAA